MKFFGRNSPAPQPVTSGRFEIERDGEVAYLQYTLSGKVLELVHTEVPENLRGQGLASQLAEKALQWAGEHNVKVDIICPSVLDYIKRHPEYSAQVLH